MDNIETYQLKLTTTRTNQDLIDESEDVTTSVEQENNYNFKLSSDGQIDLNCTGDLDDNSYNILSQLITHQQILSDKKVNIEITQNKTSDVLIILLSTILMSAIILITWKVVSSINKIAPSSTPTSSIELIHLGG